MRRYTLRAMLAASTAFVFVTPAFAQASGQQGGLEEIVVTAQKREQSMQDVPIAITAVTQENLQANRIYTVNDLSAIAPGLTVKPSAGGIQTPSFTMRGQNSFGVVAGSDKQVSVYIDGVYISSPRGSIFDLPDIARLEVLRGPQGTLFGRNATAGAVSITTRDPTGELHVKLEGTYGNYDQYRTRFTIDTPQIGPLSAIFSFVRNYRRGEIKNSQAGLSWDRSASPSGYGKGISPLWLGTVKSNSYFAAVKLEASDSFKMVYKYDRNDDHGTPEGTSIASYDGSGLFGNYLTALYTSNNVHFDPSAKRPDIVDNGWVVPRQQRVEGHSLTATWQAADHVTIKNIAAYRKATVFSPSAIDGASTLTFTQAAGNAYAPLAAFGVLGTPTGAFLGINTVADALNAANVQPFYNFVVAPHIGQRVAGIASQAGSVAKQYSDELQINYSSEKLQATFGAIWFHSNDQSGGPEGEQNTFLPLTFIPASGVLPIGNEGRSFNKATSLAAYAQLEYKLTPELEVVAGARITKDKKSSAFRYDIVSNGTTVQPTTTIRPPDYKKTKPNFLLGLNWKPSQGVLVYGKYSTSFVSGGSTAGINYDPETASSFEVGAKADFFDHRLRTNIAVFHVDYNHYQSPQGTSSPASAAIALAAFTPLYGATTAAQLVNVVSTFVIDQGKVRAQGVELEVTAAPTRGLTFGGSVGYTDVKYPYINPAVLAGQGLTGNPGGFRVTARPKWTVGLFGSYETPPLFGDATLMFRADGQYRSSINFSINPAKDLFANNSNAAAVLGTKGFMMVNSRLALRHLSIAGANAELAIWGKNITNRKDATFSLALGAVGTSNNFVNPRTYGLDLNIDF